MAEKAMAGQDPFDVLPFEPFISCIQLALPLPEKGYTQRLLQFTLVSKKWRDTILSNPVLWASINVSYSDPDALAMIAISLHLSRDAMITVTFCHSMNQHWDLFHDSITPHNHRVQRIVLIDADIPMKLPRAPSLQGWLYYLALEKLLECLGNLPAISSIDVGTSLPGIYPDHPWTERFTLPQDVRYMRQWIFQRPALGDTRTPLHHLRELHTDEPIDVILPILPTFLQLERLVLSDPVQDPRDPPEPPRKPSQTRWPQIDVPNITCLWHTQIFSDTLTDLLLKTAQNLQELVIRLPYSRIEPFMDVLVSMERLQTLTLSVTTADPADLVGLSNTTAPPAITSLRSLSLNAANNRMGSFASSRGLEVLTKLVAMYPDVTNLSIDFQIRRDIYHILPRLQRQLRTLSVAGIISPQPSASVAHEIPSLEEVSVNLGENLGWLLAPNLLRLNCDGGQFGALQEFCQCSPLLQSVTLTNAFRSIPESPDPSSFPSVQKFHLRLQRTEGATLSPRFYLVSLPSLRKLSISSVDGDMAFTHVTSLCLALLYQPDLCPNLQELEFEGVPEWDILFLMLEARNLSRNTLISPISRITMPLVPYHFRSPLASLLRGEPTTRPPNEDVSIGAMIQLYFDETVLGCFTCLYNMLPMCNFAMGTLYPPVPPYFTDSLWARLPELSLPPTISPEASSWILARPERIRRWIALGREWDQRGTRAMRCGRRGEAVTITGLDD